MYKKKPSMETLDVFGCSGPSHRPFLVLVGHRDDAENHIDADEHDIHHWENLKSLQTYGVWLDTDGGWQTKFFLCEKDEMSGAFAVTLVYEDQDAGPDGLFSTFKLPPAAKEVVMVFLFPPPFGDGCSHTVISAADLVKGTTLKDMTDIVMEEAPGKHLIECHTMFLAEYNSMGDC